MNFAVQKRSFTIHGQRLVCLIAGNPKNPAVLMIHGWCHQPDVWLSTMQALYTTHYCIAVGVLGFGESDKPANGDYRIFAHAADTVAIADALGIERFILIGQSRGGQIALALAGCTAPARVIKLIDVSGLVTGELSYYMRSFMTLPVWLGTQHKIWYPLLRRLVDRNWLATLYYRPYMDDPSRFPADFSKKEILRPLQDESRYSNYACMRTMRTTDVIACLTQIQAPTLIIFGKQDGVVPVKQGYIAEKHIPHSELVVIDHCGHYPMYEQYDIYIRHVKAFLAR